MRKSSFGTVRPLISGPPLRVLTDNVQKSRTSIAEERYSIPGRLSYVGSKLPALNPRKSSVSSSQFSFVPKSGRPSSGIGVRGRTDIPKDPRPLSDKKYQTQCIRQLLEFLMANSYPHPISQKLLVSPSSKDFFRIFEFICSKFLKGYKQVPKMEEEVPRVLKMLGYPFVLSKTYLFSVGSPHTWPYLLGALKWLIDLLQMTDSISDHGETDSFIFEPEDDSFDGISEMKIVFDYCEKTYAAFIAGQDTFEKFDEELAHYLKEKHQGGDSEHIMAEKAILEQEVGMLQQAEDRLKQLQERIAMSQHDAKAMQVYVENLEQYKKAQDGELIKRKDELEILVSDLQAKKEKLANMQEVYKKQDLTPSDIDRLRAEQDTLKQQVDYLEKEIELLESDNWSVTMEQAKLNEKVEAKAATYNRLAVNLKIVPETAELAEGVDFRITTGYAADIVANYENNIKPKLASMKKHYTTNFHQKSKEKFQLAYHIEQFQETINERKEAMAQMTKEVANIEAELDSMKQMVQSDKKTGQLDTIKQDVIRLDTLVQQTEAELKSITEEHNNTLKLLGSKKEDVQKEICALEANYSSIMQKVEEYINNLMAQLTGCMKRLDKVNSDLDQQTVQLEAESRQRDEWLKSLMRDKSGLP